MLDVRVCVFVCETRDIGAGGPSIAPLPFSSGVPCYGPGINRSRGGRVGAGATQHTALVPARRSHISRNFTSSQQNDLPQRQ